MYDDKYGDKYNIKTSGPTSRMVLPLYGGDAQGAERVYYIYVYSGTIEEEERGGVPVVYVAGGGHVEGIRSGCGADGG